MAVACEKRGARRYNLDCSVCLWHEPTHKFYNGKSVNISSSGALLKLPLSVPIRMSEEVAVNFPSPEGNESDRQPAKTFTARVVRVNRPQSMLDGRQQIALKFA